MKRLFERQAKPHRKLTPKRRPVGRPNGASSVRVIPVFRDEIDVKKLGRAALRLVMERPLVNDGHKEPSDAS